jgi:SAM-dependent methyltransferase
LTEPEFRRRALHYALGIPVSLETRDRQVLEHIILPFYDSQPDIRRVLFVGVAWYTRHYGTMCFPHKDYWTVDPSHSVRKYGARQHIEALIEDVPARFTPGYFDLVIMNGVYGHGLSEQGAVERSFEACFRLLRSGGHFLFGWNDVPEYRGAPLGSIQSLARFTPIELPVLGTHRYEAGTASRHIFEFFVKP